jgi:hypothetical protein
MINAFGITQNICWQIPANMISYSYSQKIDPFGIAIRNLDYGDIRKQR